MGRLRARAGTHRGQVGRRVPLPQQNSPVERGCRGLLGGRAVSRWLQLGLPESRCGFREQPFKRDVSFELGRLKGLSRGCHNSHAGEL